jgi:hypothetical protein
MRFSLLASRTNHGSTQTVGLNILFAHEGARTLRAASVRDWRRNGQCAGEFLRGKARVEPQNLFETSRCEIPS